jgi:hypothetical protein
MERYAEGVQSCVEVMPKEFIKMRKAMERFYGAKKGDIVAAKKWNKEHKGTGQTVGRGRK